MGKIVLADDHAIVRRVLCEQLRDFGYQVVGEAESATEVVDFVRSSQPDIVIMDYEMPGDSLVAIRRIKSLQPAPAVLVLTGHEGSEVAALCLRSGADGFLGKSAKREELLDALSQVDAGRKYANLDLTAALATAGAAMPQPLSQLSERELEVMKSLVEGRTVTEIAESLDLSVKTISTYRTRLLKKLRCKNSSDLMRLAIREGIFSAA